MVFTPLEELAGRIEELQEKMAASGMDASVIVQNADLYYFTGSCQAGHLIVPTDGEPVYLVRKSFDRARKESTLRQIHPQSSFGDVARILHDLAPYAKHIGMELDVIPFNLYSRYVSLLKDCAITDVSPLIRELRMVKSPFEVGFIRKAAEIAARMFSTVPLHLKTGIAEVAFAGELEAVFRRFGHQGAVRMRGFNQEIFYGHLMSGDNLNRPSFLDSPTGGTGLSPAYPQSAGIKKISSNEPVMVDYVSVHHGYMVDKARIYCLGRLPQRLEEAHNAALTVQEEVVKAAKPGVLCSDLYAISQEVAEKSGFSRYFMGFGEEKTSFIAHGVGLELDELPVFTAKSALPLREGMVFAMEPKMFFPRTGVVGIENTYLVTAYGTEKLTDYPDDIFYLG